jgi:hypothetical protein
VEKHISHYIPKNNENQDFLILKSSKFHDFIQKLAKREAHGIAVGFCKGVLL